MLPSTTTPAAPTSLSAAAAAKWLQVNEDFALENHHLTLLEMALCHWDLWREAMDDIHEHGAEAKDRFGVSRNRACVGRAEKSLKLFQSAMRELALDIAPASDSNRLPRSASRYGGRA